MAQMSLDELDAKQRVAAGEEFLKKKRPEWRRNVSWISMTMGDPNHCVLSQIEEKPFDEALVSLGITKEQAVSYGFLRSPNDPSTFYGTLAECWRRLGRTS